MDLTSAVYKILNDFFYTDLINIISQYCSDFHSIEVSEVHDTSIYKSVDFDCIYKICLYDNKFYMGMYGSFNFNSIIIYDLEKKFASIHKEKIVNISSLCYTDKLYLASEKKIYCDYIPILESDTFIEELAIHNGVIYFSNRTNNIYAYKNAQSTKIAELENSQIDCFFIHDNKLYVTNLINQKNIIITDINYDRHKQIITCNKIRELKLEINKGDIDEFCRLYVDVFNIYLNTRKKIYCFNQLGHILYSKKYSDLFGTAAIFISSGFIVVNDNVYILARSKIYVLKQI